MKNYKYGIEKLGREQFLSIRSKLRSELGILVKKLKDIKHNRKPADRIALYKKYPQYAYVNLNDLRLKARYINILLGLFNGTEFEKIEAKSDFFENCDCSREQYLEKFVTYQLGKLVIK